MTNLQILTIDELSTITGAGGGHRSGGTDANLPANTPNGSPSTTSTGADVSGDAPRSSSGTGNTSIDLTGMADTERNWNIRLQADHRFNDNISVDGYVQRSSRSGQGSTEVGGGIHLRF